MNIESICHEYQHPNMIKCEIDFDEASEIWRNNKQTIGNGTFKYICGHKRNDGGKCRNPPYKQHTKCHLHFKKKVQ